MDVISAAAVMSAAFCKSERHTDDETPGPPQKRLRRPAAADVCSSTSILAEVGNPGANGTTGAPGRLSAESIDLCPLCGNATFKKGGLREEVDIVARGQVGGLVASGTGRYKVRKEARKDNRLAAWYSRFGYRGPLYCKACSESFRSHLINRKSRPRCGCTWKTPCAHCQLILDGFVGMRVEEVFAKFEAHRQQRLERQTLLRPPYVSNTVAL